ncbi:hypothetical protein D3C80_510770 [compost metagenome]
MRTVVELAHQQVRVGVTYGQASFRVEDRLTKPPAHRPRPEATQLSCTQFRMAEFGEEAPETGGSEAIGHRAAIGDSRTIFCKPVAIRESKGSRPLYIARRPLGIVNRVPARIEKPVEMEGEGIVVVEPSHLSAVLVPSFTDILAVDEIKFFGEAFPVGRPADACKRIDHQNSEEAPVAWVDAGVLNLR